MELEASLEYLPQAALLGVVLHLDIRALINLSQTKIRGFLSDPHVLYELSMTHDLPITKDLNELLRYAQMNPEVLILLSAGHGDLRMIRLISERLGFNLELLSKVLDRAAETNHIEVIKYVLSNFTSGYKTALSYTIENNYLDIAELLVTSKNVVLPGYESLYSSLREAVRRGLIPLVVDMVTNIPFNPEDVLELSAGRGSMDLVHVMLSGGTSLGVVQLFTEATDYNRAMYAAAHGGHMEIVKLMLAKGANDYNSALDQAAYGGHMEIVQLMLFLGADDYRAGLYGGVFSGRMDIIELMISKGADNYNEVMEQAAIRGDTEIIELILSKGADNYDNGMSGASRSGNIKVIEWMIELGARDYNSAMVRAAEGGHIKIVLDMINRGKKAGLEYMDYNSGLLWAVSGGHIDVVRLMLSLGANNYNQFINLRFYHPEVVEIVRSYRDSQI